MSRRGKQMSYPERLACGKGAQSGKTDAQIAEATGWSIWTVRKWRRTFQKQGKAGLAPRMGRPKKGALSTYPQELRTHLFHMRQLHPGWGPITLVEEATQLPAYFGQAFPSRARVAAFLKEKRLVRRYERQAGLPRPPLNPASQVHEEWEMDAQGGQMVGGLGTVSVVNLIDVVSRLKVESYPHVWGSGLTWQDYQLVLRCAFLQYGLPRHISLDHDSAFFDNTSRSPYPSRLHLWLVALGVGVRFIEKPPPQQHALIERTHQTMTAQTLTGQTWKEQKALWQGLAQRRQFLNQVYPSRALHDQAPLEAYPQAVHSGRVYRPEWEADLLDVSRVQTFLAEGQWFRETNCHGEFWLGMQRYNAGRSCAKSTVEIRFDPHSLEFICRKVATDQTHRFRAQGIAKANLMGELSPMTRMPSFQLVLPFSKQEWRCLQLARWMGGTTL
jgi:transposase